MNIKRPKHLPAIISLGIILFAAILELYWPWGVLMLFWGVRDIATRKTWLSEPIHFDETPWLFSTIIAVWLVLGLYFFSELALYLG
ncbi:MAG: hypothetical protein OXE99_15045 [Cellvibrionales bacterium]|nr:hypothetical protein [Cellvibrionales bacterium]